MEFNNLNDLEKLSGILNFQEQYDLAKKELENLFCLNPDCKPIFIAVTGSISYGLSLKTSDIDVKFVYMQDYDSLIGSFNKNYKSQLQIKKNDIVGYELGRVLELLTTNNPNTLELLKTPNECVIYTTDIWQSIINELKDNILSAKCKDSFSNYSYNQVKIATGLRKKINNPVSIIMKSPLDFCYVIENGKTTSLISFLETKKISQRNIGVISLNNTTGIFALYHSLTIPYKGIVKETDGVLVSNDICLSSIPKDEKLLAYMSYNKDGYSMYCKDYNEYHGVDGWINQRNAERYNDNIKNGQNYNGKNLSHCLRLLNISKQIALTNDFSVRVINKEERELLLKIKKGMIPYDDIMKIANDIVNDLDNLYNNSSLPKQVDVKFVLSILLKYRKIYYNSMI